MRFIEVVDYCGCHKLINMDKVAYVDKQQGTDRAVLRFECGWTITCDESYEELLPRIEALDGQ